MTAEELLKTVLEDNYEYGWEIRPQLRDEIEQYFKEKP